MIERGDREALRLDLLQQRIDEREAKADERLQKAADCEAARADKGGGLPDKDDKGKGKSDE